MSAVSEIAAEAPCSPPRRDCGPSGAPVCTVWTPEMDAVLRAEYRAAGPTVLAARLGVPEPSVRWRAGYLGVRRPVAARIAWTAEADAALRADYARLGGPALAARLGCTPAAVRRRASVLGLTTPTAPHIAWTPARVALLRRLWGLVPARIIGQQVGATTHAVREQANKLGLNAERNRADALDRAERNAERAGLLLAWEKHLISPVQAAAALGVPATRLPRLSLEVAMWAARGIERERTA